MPDASEDMYQALDRPEILSVLFHPRKQHPAVGSSLNCREIMIPVENGIHIGTRLHTAEDPTAAILFFHGNGEIAADYDDLGPLYTQMGIDFWVADYRGYGKSDGRPTIAAMLTDCHKILEYVIQTLASRKTKIPLIIMGRSLGSASALELARHRSDRIAGLIIESGFAYAGPLLRLLGADPEAIGFKEENGFGNLAKISGFTKPTLIIHAEFDHIIAFSDGRALFEKSPARHKRLLKIPRANHNDIFARGLTEYMTAVKELAVQVAESS